MMKKTIIAAMALGMFVATPGYCKNPVVLSPELREEILAGLETPEALHFMPDKKQQEELTTMVTQVREYLQGKKALDMQLLDKIKIFAKEQMQKGGVTTSLLLKALHEDLITHLPKSAAPNPS